MKVCRMVSAGELPQSYETMIIWHPSEEGSVSDATDVAPMLRRTFPLFGDVFANSTQDEDRDFEKLWCDIALKLSEMTRLSPVRDYRTVFGLHFDGIRRMCQSKYEREPTLDEMKEALQAGFEADPFLSFVVVDTFERSRGEILASFKAALGSSHRNNRSESALVDRALRTGDGLNIPIRTSQIEAWAEWIKVYDAFEQQKPHGLAELQKLATSLGMWPLPTSKAEAWRDVERVLYLRRQDVIRFIWNEESGLHGLGLT